MALAVLAFTPLAGWRVGWDAERGETGRKGAVTLGWVIFDVHVKALTRGMWPACTLE